MSDSLVHASLHKRKNSQPPESVGVFNEFEAPDRYVGAAEKDADVGCGVPTFGEETRLSYTLACRRALAPLLLGGKGFLEREGRGGGGGALSTHAAIPELRNRWTAHLLRSR